MGYYTRYELEVLNDFNSNVDYESEITNATAYSEYGSCFDGEIKWYDYAKDMLNFSKKHPNQTFVINGQGEESGDIWKAYFKNGKMFRTKATLKFEDFNEDKLQ